MKNRFWFYESHKCARFQFRQIGIHQTSMMAGNKALAVMGSIFNTLFSLLQLQETVGFVQRPLTRIYLVNEVHVSLSWQHEIDFPSLAPQKKSRSLECVVPGRFRQQQPSWKTQRDGRKGLNESIESSPNFIGDVDPKHQFKLRMKTCFCNSIQFNSSH